MSLVSKMGSTTPQLQAVNARGGFAKTIGNPILSKTGI